MDTDTQNDNPAQSDKVCTKCLAEYSAHAETCPEDGCDLVSKSVIALVGTRFDERYQIISLLGVGGIGAVYKAEHENLKQIVALKVLHQNLLDKPDKIERFEREAKALSALSHINVVSAHDYGWTSQMCPYLVMQYVEGKSLEKVIVEEGGLPPDRAIDVFIQICEGLSYAHKKGIVHRDLKPANTLLVNHEGSGDLVKLVDFGIAKLLPDSGLVRQKLTQTGHVFGSPSYMSPEQWRGQPIDNRSDIYSMGCMFYELLSGQKPLDVESLLSVMLDSADIKPQMLAFAKSGLQVSADFEETVLKTLETDIEKRYQTVDQVIEALKKTPEWKARSEQITSSRSQVFLSLRQKRALQSTTRKIAFLAIPLVVTAAAVSWLTLTDAGALQSAKFSVWWEKSVHGADAPSMIASEKRLGELYLRQGQLQAAAMQFEGLFEVVKLKSGANSLELAEIQDRLAEIYSQLKGQEQKANQYARDAALAFDRLAASKVMEKQVDQAIELYKKAMIDKVRMLGPQSLVIAQSLGHIADVEVSFATSSKRNEYLFAAEADYKRTLEILEKLSPPDMAEIAAASRGLGLVYFLEDKPDQSIATHEKALARVVPETGEQSLAVKMIVDELDNMGYVFFKKGDYVRAARVYERVAANREKVLGSASPATVLAYFMLGSSYQSQRKMEQALPLFRKALSMCEKGNSSILNQATILESLASTEFAAGEFSDSLRDSERLIKIARQTGEPMRLRLIHALEIYSNSLMRLGRADEARKATEEMVRLNSPGAR